MHHIYSNRTVRRRNPTHKQSTSNSLSCILLQKNLHMRILYYSFKYLIIFLISLQNRKFSCRNNKTHLLKNYLNYKSDCCNYPLTSLRNCKSDCRNCKSDCRNCPLTSLRNCKSDRRNCKSDCHNCPLTSLRNCKSNCCTDYNRECRMQKR